jgi:Transposase DDE domain group 1
VHRSPRPRNVEIRADDPSLTSHAGLLLVGELAARTDLVVRLDRAIDAVRPFKVRRRGRSGGELLVALAELMVVGGDHLLHLDELREDEAGAELRAVAATPAPTTAGQLMRRLNARQCQAVVRELARIGEEVDGELGLSPTGPVTLDLDSFDSEVYGRRKQGAAFNHRGQRCYDTQVATWAERRRILAAELRSGNLNEHPTAIKVLGRALAALPAIHGPVRARMDCGFESVAIFEELRRQKVGFTCSLQRTPTLHRLRLKIPSRVWRPALQMPQAEIAETTYAHQGWRHEPMRLIVRRVRVPVEELSEDPRSRRRRTVPKAQLELALAGRVEYVYAYSFILTDLDGDAAEIEHWHRQRAQIEERVKELKLGDGLLHFPLGTLDANRVWQTAGVIAHNVVALLSAVVADVNHRRLREQLEQSPEPPRRPAAARVAVHNTKLVRRWLLAVPGRVLHSGRRVVLRLAQDMLWAATFVAAYQRLRMLTPCA